MLTLTGSRAAKVWYPDFRTPQDWDWISDKPVPDNTFASNSRNDVFVDERLAEWNWGAMASPEELYTMKISHSFWVINNERNWDKHASDIIFFQRKGVDFYRPLYDILLPIWKERYKRNPTNLNQNKDNFFKDAVKRKYDHDSVHASIAYGDHPLYEDILKDGSDVAVDNDKFWAMDLETQLKTVREEIYATALERILIPANYKGSPTAAYWWALRRTATSLFKGEWALFLMLHLDELARPDVPYLQVHLDNMDKLIPLEVSC